MKSFQKIRYLLSMFACIWYVQANSQVHIGSETSFTTGTTTVATNVAIFHEGAGSWGKSSLHLTGEGSVTTINDWEIADLVVHGSHDFFGDFLFGESLQLFEGVLTPEAGSQLIVAPNAMVSSADEAHINGQLYHQGSGEKFYPIGKNGVHTPVTLTGVAGERDLLVGLEAFNQDLGLTEFPADVNGASSEWYWQINAPGNFSGSKIMLPVTDADAAGIGAGGVATVLQTDLNGSGTTDLGSDPSSDFLNITSELSAIGPYVLVGFESDLKPTIHNIITPKNDDKNPFLIIDHIDAITENEVILFDRWGNQVFQERNFTNYARNGNGGRAYDGSFDALPSGNYICLIKYQGTTKRQMVTILQE